jgi:ribosome hibernation promoting factor
LKINITGRHLDVTPAMKKYTQEKVEKLGRFYDRIHGIDAILSEEGDRQVVEVKAHVGKGTTLVGKVENSDIYSALDLVVGKLERQITRYKEKLRSWKGRPATIDVATPPDSTEEDEDTYEDVVRELTTGED